MATAMIAAKNSNKAKEDFEMVTLDEEVLKKVVKAITARGRGALGSPRDDVGLHCTIGRRDGNR